MDSDILSRQLLSLYSRDDNAPPPPVMMAAVPPPPGVTQNFIDPPLAATDAPILVAVGVAIAGILLLVRIYTKGFLLRKFGAEDGMLRIFSIKKGKRCGS